MAKKIRFPLEMENGVEVRSMEELRNNFSISRVLSYLKNGKLEVWLRDRFEIDIADKIGQLDFKDEDLAKNIYEIFNIPFDVAAIREYRIALIKKYNDNEKVEDIIDSVAFTQDELNDLLDKDLENIYLYGDKFYIPLTKKGICYRGINKPTIVVASDTEVDWIDKKILLENVIFDSKYQLLVENITREKSELLKKIAEEAFRKNNVNINEIGMVEFEAMIEDIGKIIGSKIFTNIWSSEKAYLLLDRILLVNAGETMKFDGYEELYVDGSLSREGIIGFVYNNITANNENLVIGSLFRSLKSREPLKALSIILNEYEKFSSSNDILCETNGRDKNIALNLIFDYHSCNVFAKKIIEKTKLTIDYSNTSYSSEWKNRVKDISWLSNVDNKKEARKLFINYCRDENTVEESYKFIFWSLMVLAVDKNNADVYLSLICDFASMLKISSEEFADLIYAIECVFNQKNQDYKFKSEIVPRVFHKLFNMYG